MIEDGKSLFFSPKSGNKSPDIQVVALPAPTRHALQALSALARRPEDHQDTAALARQCRLQPAALSKSFQRLARIGLLEARRGPRGGYRLARPPESVTLDRVVAALNGRGKRLGRCFLEERTCQRDAPCLLHGATMKADKHLARVLRRLTLADLAAGARVRGRRA